ncbi:hypothetical protein FHW79_005912 [Azospirillum sp. OGB3]|nr:hypothetical protein [Azospirillum sp. OGB3]
MATVLGLASLTTKFEAPGNPACSCATIPGRPAGTVDSDTAHEHAASVGDTIMPKDLQAFIHETRKATTALMRSIAHMTLDRHDDAGRAAKTAIH